LDEIQRFHGKYSRDEKSPGQRSLQVLNRLNDHRPRQSNPLRRSRAELSLPAAHLLVCGHARVDRCARGLPCGPVVFGAPGAGLSVVICAGEFLFGRGGYPTVAAKDPYGWEFGLWVLGLVLCIHVVLHAFVRVVQWPCAMPPDRAEAQWPGEIDPSWRAVVGDHGRPREWPLGTVADNPAGFAAWATALAAGGLGLRCCFRRLKADDR
jgi:hypothetical protein